MSDRVQCMAALESANAIRLRRSDLRRAIRSGETTLADALESPDARQQMVWQLVRCQHGWADVKVNRLYTELVRQGVPVDYQKRVRMLTVRQRLALIAGVAAMPKQIQRPNRKPRVTMKYKPRVKPTLTLLTVAGEDEPPRCRRCKTRLRESAPSGLCGFCEVEADEDLAA
jgi:hypothetical protein